ncbi:MAG: hypothetical protein JF593_14285 [Novosphingobium sp.]|nr:hypothetical protein [Novosphingobium sp.]
MSIGELGVLVPIFAMSIPIVAIVARHRTRMAELQLRNTAESSAERAAQYVAHTKELEDRVRVLERIVTDKGYDVATQIEALRDARTVEAKADDRSANR